MGNAAARRRVLVITLGVCLLILFLALATLNAFNLKFLNPASPTQTLVFIALLHSHPGWVRHQNVFDYRSAFQATVGLPLSNIASLCVIFAVL